LNKIIVLVCFILSLVSHAQTIYTCTVDDVTVFSQSPCGNVDKKIDVTVVTPSITYDKIKANTKQVASKTPQQYFDDINLAQSKRKIRNIESKIKSHQRKLDIELETLKSKKRNAMNNTAGAIYEDSISNEMIAVTNKYTIKINQERERIDNLKQKISRLSTK